MTVFRIEIKDEAMDELLEQSAGARLPPPVFLSAIANDTLLRAKDENLKIVVPGQTENIDLH